MTTAATTMTAATTTAAAKKGGGGDDDAGGGDDDDDAGGEDATKTQPPVTAGGNFTLNSYPIAENKRPLTMTKGIGQLRLGLGTDLSAKGAFGSVGVSLEGQYGYTDNFTLIGGLTDAYDFHQFEFYAGFEGALVYDLLDIRVAADVHRNALPEYANFCDPPVTPNEMAQGDVNSGMQTCQGPMASIDATCRTATTTPVVRSSRSTSGSRSAIRSRPASRSSRCRR